MGKNIGEKMRYKHDKIVGERSRYKSLFSTVKKNVLIEAAMLVMSTTLAIGIPQIVKADQQSNIVISELIKNNETKINDVLAPTLEKYPYFSQEIQGELKAIASRFLNGFSFCDETISVERSSKINLMEIARYISKYKKYSELQLKIAEKFKEIVLSEDGFILNFYLKELSKPWAIKCLSKYANVPDAAKAIIYYMVYHYSFVDDSNQMKMLSQKHLVECVEKFKDMPILAAAIADNFAASVYTTFELEEHPPYIESKGLFDPPGCVEIDYKYIRERVGIVDWCLKEATEILSEERGNMKNYFSKLAWNPGAVHQIGSMLVRVAIYRNREEFSQAMELLSEEQVLNCLFSFDDICGDIVSRTISDIIITTKDKEAVLQAAECLSQFKDNPKLAVKVAYSLDYVLLAHVGSKDNHKTIMDILKEIATLDIANTISEEKVLEITELIYEEYYVQRMNKLKKEEQERLLKEILKEPEKFRETGFEEL
jgi:hypothetical protein